jgi:sugar phosphate isomerase/epimerase
MFAFSTSWHALQHSHAEDIVKEIKLLGFNRLELNFNLSDVIVEEMFSLQKRGLFKVVSMHNFCPIPPGTTRKQASPDLFSLSSTDEGRRRKAVLYTKKTIDTACRFGAKAVVLHLGKVQMEEKIRELAAFYLSGEKQKFEKLKRAMLKEREKKVKRFLDRTFKSLEQLCKYSEKQKVKLGIENRYYFCEIPSPSEMESILAEFPGPPLYYWHDVGHAQVYENLRFIKHKAMLDKFGRRMLGIHLHDVKGIDDHRAPLKGEFDFSLLKPYVKSDTLKVLEPHYPATAEEITRGWKYLKKLFKGVEK